MVSFVAVHRDRVRLGQALARLISVGLIVGGICGAQAIPTFQHHVRPLFEQRCIACHGEVASAGLDLRNLEAAVRGSSSGPVILPGDPTGSVLWKKIASDEMPIGGAPLSTEEKRLVREWIEKGHFPQRDLAAEALEAEQRVRKAAKGVWAFRPPVKGPAPEAASGSPGSTPIDAFVLQKLEGVGLALNPEADRETLIRRAYLDLTGLPPSPEEVSAFVEDESSRAYEELVDRLLASPAYGERWARHWMDVAGYADGNGFLGDEPRTHAWQYRDWVIRALNSDMPYDEFLIAQLAGDQVADWRPGHPLTPKAADLLRATGFLRLTADGTDNQTIYQIDKQWDAFHMMTEVTTEAVIGINMNCVRCHDHKFDPFLQTDYYRIMAIYRPVFDPDPVFPPPPDRNWLAANVGSGPWPARFVLNADQETIDRFEALHAAEPTRRDVGEKKKEAESDWRRKRFSELGEPLRSELLAVLDTPLAERTAQQTDLLTEHETRFKIEDDELAALYPEYAAVKTQYEANQTLAKEIQPEMIWAAWDVTTKPPIQHVLLRGSYESPGEAVAPGVPVVLDDPENPFLVPSPPKNSEHTGRRLAFAEWLTKPDHPLTARVIANRVWQYHFGRGIVATPDDFGSQGAPPTHPELLDWLAVSLIEHDWSLKWLHREVMLSAVYRQSSNVDEAKYRLDEPNNLLGRWEPRRLEAEAIRDAVLEVSGLLNRTMYGDPIALCSAPDGNYLPETSGRIDGKKINGFEFDPPPCEEPAGKPAPDRDPNRRSIYLQIRREAAAGFLEAFDQPLMDTNASVRFRSAVPKQALSALHNPLMMEASASLASRVRDEAGEDLVAQVSRAIELVYSRPASEAEVSFGFSRISATADEEKGLRLFCQALLGSSEFLYIN